MAREFANIGVVGLGTMGAGIAEVFARSGRKVTGYEPDAAALERGRGHLQRSTDRAVARGKLDADGQTTILDLVSYTSTLEDLSGCDLVIEAVPEQLALKLAVFADLDRVCGPDTVLATNTSSLSVTDIAASTHRPAQVVGMHFFNPAPVMRLVEVVSTIVTDPGLTADIEALATALGKTDVTITDRAGFIANALLFGYLNRAVRMLESGRATRDDIDAAMTDGVGLPMGPFTLLDLIGLDTGEDILATMYRQTGEPRYVPARTLSQMVVAGLLGRKSGRGFYTYGEGSGDAAPPAASCERPGVRVAVAGPAEQVGESSLARLRAACAEAGILAADGADSSITLVADLASSAELPAAGVVAVTDGSGRLAAAAAAGGRPADVIGLRLAGVPGARGVVEVVRTPRSSDAAVAAGVALAGAIGRRAIVCADRAGGVVDALLMPHLNDAIQMLEESYADTVDIDAAMTLGCGYPVGPIALADAIGLDRVLGTQRAIHAETPQAGLVPSPLLVEYAAAGLKLGASGHREPTGP